jgi:hypothetical protein
VSILHDSLADLEAMAIVMAIIITALATAFVILCRWGWNYTNVLCGGIELLCGVFLFLWYSFFIFYVILRVGRKQDLKLNAPSTVGYDE